jgi:hypothetical protein
MFYQNIHKLEAQWAEPGSLSFHSVLRKLYTEPSIYASYQVSVHLAKQFQRRRFFKNRPFRNKNCLWAAIFKSPKQRLGNLLFLLRFLLFFFFLLFLSFFPWHMNLSTADLRNYWTEFHETWWSYRYMFLVGPKVLW